jgi:hypothetical protein
LVVQIIRQFHPLLRIQVNKEKIMYCISINEEFRIANVYDDSIYLDEGVTVFPITDEQFKTIRETGYHNDWLFKDGQLVSAPLEKLDPFTPLPRQLNKLPVEIL